MKLGGDWDETLRREIEAIRDSERLTGEDMATRINATDDAIPEASPPPRLTDRERALVEVGRLAVKEWRSGMLTDTTGNVDIACRDFTAERELIGMEHEGMCSGCRLPIHRHEVSGHRGEPPESEPIHAWFELSCARYLTVPRSVLQSMPLGWQERFVKCMKELDDKIDWRPTYGRYWVRLCSDEDGECEINDPLADYERGRRFIAPRPEAKP